MIDVIASVNWISLLVLSIKLLLFKALVKISYKVNWTFVILISMVMGGVIGIVFASEGNTYLVWLDLIGQIYVNLITALVVPVVLISVISGFITLNDKEKMKNIGVKSVVWLLLAAVGAIVVTMIVGVVTGIGKGGGAVFADIASVTDTTVNAYKDMGTSLDQVLLSLFPTNVIKCIYPITYRQLEWLTDQDGNSLIMMGGPGSEKTRSIISTVNQYAVKNNVRVYMYDPQIDGAYTTDKWGYKQTIY